MAKRCGSGLNQRTFCAAIKPTGLTAAQNGAVQRALLGGLDFVEVGLRETHRSQWSIFQHGILERLAVHFHHLQAFFLELTHQGSFAGP